MSHLTSEQFNTVLNFLSTINPLTLAIMFIGLISIGVIWLASIAIKALLKAKQ